MTHGTRKAYQAGCPCTGCRAANAAYSADLRRQHRQGIQPLGAHVSAIEASRRIRLLLTERFRKGEIARQLGLKRPILELHTDVITLRNHLKIRRLYRLAILEGQDGPEVPLG